MKNHYMKWRIIGFVLAIVSMSAFRSLAQVSTYAFSTTTTTYTPITGGVVFGNATSDDQRFVDVAVPLGGTGTTGVGIPIGFDFVFNTITFDRLAINNNGWISLGSSTLSPSVNIQSSSSYTPLSATSTATPTLLRNRIAAIGRDLAAQAGSELRVETIGTAPNRVCVVQWTNYRKFTATGDNYNFQIRLYETTNAVEVVYGTFVNNATNLLAQVGLGGTVNTDFNNRTTTTDWSATTAGGTNTATCTANASVVPASGTVFRWVAPPPTPPAPFQVAPSASCATGTQLDVIGTPGVDVTWYWQSTAAGTDFSTPYSGPYSVFSNGTYYLRAYNAVTMAWSINSSSVTVTDFPLAADPSAPVAAVNPACNSTDITVTTPPAGIEYYWQGNAPGSSNALLADVPYNVTTTGTYYVAAYEVATQCWSNSIGVAVTISTTPPAVPTPGALVYDYCSGSASMPITATVATGTLEWFDDLTAGNLLATGSPLETVGTSVLPNANIPGTYNFYVGSTNGCQSTRVLVEVRVADVLVALTPVNETCTNYSNGTFSVSGVTCGVAPFTYSVDGGAFGPAPTNLTAGTYSVVVEDFNGDQSAPIDVTIGTTETVIPFAPTTTEPIVYACSSDASIQINAQGTTLIPGSLTTTFAAGNGCTAGNMFDIAANSMDIIVEELDILMGSGTSVNVYYVPGGYAGNETNAAAWTLVGTYPVGGTGLQNVDIDDFTIPTGQTYGIFVNADLDYTTISAPTVYSNADITITAGRGLCTAWTLGNNNRAWNGTVYYQATIPATVEWFDAPSFASNLQGTGSPFETVGTSVLPTVANGSYVFYAYAFNNGCYSVDPLLVEVNVNPVKVELDSIDASCNNQANGSFAIASVFCGAAPFTFSVDGGAFGPAPTNLLPGTYEVIVQDFNGDQSASYFVTVGEAAPPSGVYMETITDNGGQVSWTANGTETEWYVEWGLPGFTPGTGTEVGAAVASDTFWIITGADDNTNYDVYIAANCGPAEIVGDWTMVNFTTECGIYTLPFAETFEDNSETRICWDNEYVAATSDWTYHAGSSGGTVLSAYEGSLNARFVSLSGVNSPITKLVSPRFDFTGQDSIALVFAYAQENWVGDQNITKVYVASQTSPWTEIQSYNGNVAQWTVDTLYLSDTVFQIAFEGINNFGRANVIDDVQFLPCTLVSGTDGSVDACRLDNTVDLNSVIVRGETFGKWYFQNQTFIVDDTIADISLLPAGSYEFYYVVETPCAIDTTVATITVFGPSSAGNDGTITVCRNEPFDLLSALSGTVDLGGTWYDPANNAMPTSAIIASDIPGQFNYDYITSNGVCPADTANVVVNVSPSCDWLTIEEVEFASMELFPNPTTGVVYITNEGSTEVFSYELTDLNGKVIASASDAINGTETTEISLAKLEPGMYLIKVANENAEHTFRVIKQ